MASSYFQQMMAVLAAAGAGGGGGPVAAKDCDFTSSLPADWTFTRASTTEAIVGTQFAPVAANQPRIESWGGVSRGVAVDGVITNRCQNGSNPTAWGSITNITTSTETGQILPDGTTGSVAQFTETATTGNHSWQWVISGASAGVCTFWLVWRNVGSVQRNLVLYAQDVVAASFRPELGAFDHCDPAQTSATTGRVVLGDGWQLSWLTYDLGATTPSFVRGYMRPLESATIGSNAGDTNAVMQFWHAQHVAGRRLGPRIVVPSTTAVPSTAETLTLGALTGISTSTGTFVIEHDGSAAGPLITSDGNTVASAVSSAHTGYQTQRLAVAYNAGGTHIVNNGGAQTTGAALTFGSTLAIAAGVRIKRIRWYAQDLTEAQMWELTRPPITGSAGVPNALRVAGSRGCLPFLPNGPCGSSRNVMVRFKDFVGSGARRNLKLSFNNWYLHTSGEVNNTNSVTIQSCALEINGITVPLTFGGSASRTMAPGEVDVQTDFVLPGAFGLTEFAQDTQAIQRVHYVLPDNTSYIACGHFQNSGDAEAQMQKAVFDSASTTIVNGVSGTGAFTFTGTAPVTMIYGSTRTPTGVMLGEYTTAAGDPKTYFLTGASALENSRSYFKQAIELTAGGKSAMVSLSVGGTSTRNFYTPTYAKWTQYLQYVRVGVTECGVNDNLSYQWHQPIWWIYRQAPSIAHLSVVKHTPICTTTDNYTTSAGMIRATGSNLNGLRGRRLVKVRGLNSGYVDSILNTDAGTQQSPPDDELWLTDGVTPFLMTDDGGHLNLSGSTIVAPSIAAQLDAIEIPA